MKFKNKEVIQSYLLTSARYNFNVHEKLVLYRLVEICQIAFEGKKLDKNFSISEMLFNEHKIVSMPITAFIPEGDTNYERAKQALKSLRAKEIELDTPEKWKVFGIIEEPEIDKGSGIAQFRITKEIWDALQTFTKGHSRYLIEASFSFESVYTMRFSELFYEQKQPITYTVDNLKIMFQIIGKYSRGSDFIKRVIKPAQEELTQKYPWSFKYTEVRKGKKLHAITFFPYFIPENQDDSVIEQILLRQQSISWDIPFHIVKYLKETFYFTDKELKNNVRILKESDEKFDILNFVSDLRVSAEKATNPKGYLINALKKRLEV